MTSTPSIPRPLTVLVTRPQRQGEALCRMIEEAGGRSIHLPLLEIKACIPSEETLSRLAKNKSYDWLIFISANAVQYGVTAVAAFARQNNTLKVAAIGQATAHKLESLGITVDLHPEEPASSETLLACPAFEHAAHLKCLIIRGVGGREYLADELQRRGATVDYLEVYQRVPIAIKHQRFIELSQQDAIDVVALTSGESLEHLTRLLPQNIRESWLTKPVIVIGKRMEKQAEALGYSKVLSTAANNQAIVDAVIELGRGKFQF